MLVFLKENMGRSSIGPYHIYGKFYAYGSFGPTNIPRNLFHKNKDILEEAEVTKEWLKRKTGIDFPVSFRISEMYRLDFNVVIDIAQLLGIKYIKSRKPTTIEKYALRKAISQKIDEL